MHEKVEGDIAVDVVKDGHALEADTRVYLSVKARYVAARVPRTIRSPVRISVAAVYTQARDLRRRWSVTT